MMKITTDQIMIIPLYTLSEGAFSLNCATRTRMGFCVHVHAIRMSIFQIQNWIEHRLCAVYHITIRRNTCWGLCYLGFFFYIAQRGRVLVPGITGPESGPETPDHDACRQGKQREACQGVKNIHGVESEFFGFVNTLTIPVLPIPENATWAI